MFLESHKTMRYLVNEALNKHGRHEKNRVVTIVGLATVGVWGDEKVVFSIFFSLGS